MTDSSSFSLSNFLSLESSPDDDEDDELNEDFLSSLTEDEQYLRVILDEESASARARNSIDHSLVDDWIKTARSAAIEWIFNMRSVSSLRFRLHTAYLSVTFIDRFISQSQSQSQSFSLITSDKPWGIRLLAVACLSLAAKTIDHTNWMLSSLLQTKGFEFSMNAVQRMELLVLTTLDWRMHSITPFHFIRYFVSCLCNESLSSIRFLSLISKIVCAATVDLDLMGHRSYTIAMAATLMAIDQGLTRESIEMKVKTTWVSQLFDHVDVYTCYSQMLKLEPLQVNIFKPDSTKNEENPSKRRKHS